jgi:hypothetical protein
MQAQKNARRTHKYQRRPMQGGDNHQTEIVQIDESGRDGVDMINASLGTGGYSRSRGAALRTISQPPGIKEEAGKSQ